MPIRLLRNFIAFIALIVWVFDKEVRSVGAICFKVLASFDRSGNKLRWGMEPIMGHGCL